MITAGQRDAIARGVAVLGLVVVVVGTFLPWLRSGHATRNSYRASGTIRRIIHPPGPLGVLFTVWPLLAVAAAAAIALLVLRMRRLGALIGLLTALLAGGAAFEAVRSASSAYAAVVTSGPTATLIGAGLIIVAAPVCFVTARPARRSNP